MSDNKHQTLGIHRFICSEDGQRQRSSFFIERPFGNLLIFTDFLSDTHDEFLKAKGGVARQFIESAAHITKIQVSLFNRFGASAVGDFMLAPERAPLPIYRYGKDWSDPALEFHSHGAQKLVILNQRKRKVALLGDSYFLNKDNHIEVSGCFLSEQDKERLGLNECDTIFFSHRYFSK